MSAAVKEAVDNIIIKHFQFQSRIEITGFTSLLTELKTLAPDIELNEEIIQEIFKILHPDENGLISMNEVEKLINTIIPICADKQENRSSIIFDPKEQKFVPVSQISQNSKIQTEKHKIASGVLNALSLEKLSDLKFIYHSADKNNRKFVEYGKLMKIANDLKAQLSLSEEEIKSLFNAIKDEETSLVSFELLSELISTLEKDIFNCFNEGEEQPRQERSLSKKKNEKIELEMDDHFDMMEESGIMPDHPNQMINKIREEILKLLISKIGEADTLSKKLKSIQLSDIMKDLKKYVEEMEKRLFLLEENVNKLLKNHELNVSKEDLQFTKMKALESDIKIQFQIVEKLEEENTQIYKELEETKESSEKFRVMCQTQREEIFRLEDLKLKENKEKEHLKIQLYETLKKLDFANENYQELQKMIQKGKFNSADKSEKNMEQPPKESIVNSEIDVEEEKDELNIDLVMKDQEISRLNFENSNLHKRIKELEASDEQNDQIIVSLKIELNKIKENDTSPFQNSSSNLASSFSGRPNLKNEIKLSEFSSIFNPRISMINRISNLNRSSLMNRVSIKKVIKPSFNAVEEEKDEEEKKNENPKVNEKLDENSKDIKKTKQIEKQKIINPPIEYKYLYFDEASLFAKDFLGIREDPILKTLLMDNEEERSDLECFTDYINRLFLLEKKKKIALFISNRNMYFLNPRKFKIIRKIPLPSIKQIVISEKSAVLLGLKIKNEVDDLIECFRRADLILFLMQVFKKQGYQMFERVFEKEYFNIRIKGKTYDLKNDPKILQRFNPEIQQVYKNALKIGFLAIYKDELFFSTWKECFFLLTNVGLISFKREGEVKPLHFIPILGCLIDEKPIINDKSFCFKIYYVESDREVLLAAKSEAEKNEWIDVFIQMKKKNNLEEKLN